MYEGSKAGEMSKADKAARKSRKQLEIDILSPSKSTEGLRNPQMYDGDDCDDLINSDDEVCRMRLNFSLLVRTDRESHLLLVKQIELLATARCAENFLYYRFSMSSHRQEPLFTLPWFGFRPEGEGGLLRKKIPPPKGGKFLLSQNTLLRAKKYISRCKKPLSDSK